MKSFFSKVAAFFKKALSNTQWEQTVITTLNIVGPLIQSIIAMTAGEAAAASVGAVMSEVSRDLATIMGLVQTYELGDHATISGRITTLADEVKANLAGLLAAGHVKNDATVSKLSAIVTAVNGELDAVVKSLPVA